MIDPIFKVLQPGIQASWQDLGRVHSTHHGVSEGGVMDIHAAFWANRLLGQDAEQAVIEVAMGLFELEFVASCRFAITGAGLGASLAGQEIQPWRSYSAEPGMHLNFTTANKGFRAYLAFNVQFELQHNFASVAVSGFSSQSGSLQQGSVVSGEVIGFSDDAQKIMPVEYIPDYSNQLTLKLIPGYQFGRFGKASIDLLLQSEYQIQSNSNRMACRLYGEPIQNQPQTLLSEGIAFGAVQIPPDGQPVILLNDRQTMGGYPKLGCITRASAAALTQRYHPGKLRFKLTTIEAAKAEYQEFRSFFSAD